MTTQNSKLDGHNSLWFFMSRKGEPVADIAKDAGVNLAYVNPSDDTYVSVSGTAAVVEDQAKKEELWSKLAQAWFPGGVTDADLALVQVRIEHANYWDIGESKIVQLFHLATAAMTGKPPTCLGEHAENQAELSAVRVDWLTLAPRQRWQLRAATTWRPCHM